MRQRGVMGALWRSWGLIGDLCSLELSPGPKWGPGVPSDPLPKPLVNLFLSSHNPAPCRRFQPTCWPLSRFLSSSLSPECPLCG